MKRLFGRSGFVAVLILLITGTISFMLSINDYRKSVLDTAEAEFITRYFPALETVCDEALNGDDEITEACVGIAFEKAENVRAAWLYNVETGRVSCAEGNRYSEKHPEYFYDLMPDGRIVSDTALNRTVKYRVFDGAQYSYKSLDDYRIIMLHDISGYVREMKDTILSTIVLYFATGVFTAAVILLLRKINRVNLRHGLTMALLFLWVFGLSAYMFFGTYQMYTESKKEFNGIVLGYIDEDVEGVLELSDGEAEEFCKTYCPERYSGSLDPHKVLAEFYAEAYADGDYIISIRAKDNILDRSTPIAERVDIAWSGNGNELTECIIRSVTIGILASVLYFEWMDSRKRRQGEAQADSSLKAFQNSVTFLGISAGLVKAVLVVILTEIAKEKGVTIDGVITISAVAIFLAEPLRSYISDSSLDKHLSFKRVLFGNTVAVLVSMIVCALSSNLYLYLAGFVLIQICGDASCAFRENFVEIKGSNTAAEKLISDIVNSYRGGNIVGMIATGIIAGLISNRLLFLIAALFAFISLLFTGKCDIESEVTDLPGLDYKHLFSKRDVRLFFLLVVVVAGTLSYFYDYAIPIAISNLNYSAGTISFVYLLSSLSKYMFVYAKQRTALRNLKLKNMVGAYIYLLTEAVLLSFIIFKPTIIIISIMMVLFGILDSWTFRGNICTTLYSKARETDSKGNLVDLVDIVSEAGSFLTSAVVSTGLPVALLPVIVIASPILYGVLQKKYVRGNAAQK